MQNLMPPVNTPDNLFHDGNPTAGIEGTIVTAEFLNNEQSATRDIQSELINVLAAAAMEPDPKKKNQLVDAIKAIIEESTNAVSGNFLAKSNNLSDAADAAKCCENIGALPTSGGTLTGNLSGTSAEFTSSVTGEGIFDTPGVRVYSPNNKPTATELGVVRANGGTHNVNAHRIAIDWGADGKLWASVDDTDQGQLYTSENPPPAQDLSGYMRGDWSSTAGFVADSANDPYMRHTRTDEVVILARRDWADSRFVYDVQRGSQALENGSFLSQSDWEAPTGCFMTGIKTRTDLGDARTMGKYYRALMIKTASGSWRQVGN